VNSGGGPRARTVKEPKRRARDEAAKAVGVSPKSVARADRIRKADPEKAEEVRAGTKSVRAAEREVKAAETSKAIPEPADEPELLDEMDRPIPPPLRSAWTQIEKAMGAINKHLVAAAKEATTQEHELMAIGGRLERDSASARLIGRYLGALRQRTQNDRVISQASFGLREIGPYAVCQPCEGKGCEACSGCGAHERSRKTALQHEAKRAANGGA